jgi:hypothetical protein
MLACGQEAPASWTETLPPAVYASCTRVLAAAEEALERMTAPELRDGFEGIGMEGAYETRGDDDRDNAEASAISSRAAGSLTSWVRGRLGAEPLSLHPQALQVALDALFHTIPRLRCEPARSRPSAARAANRNQFSSEDIGIEVAISRAHTIDAGGFQLRLAMVGDLLILKLAAAEEQRRRPSKRRQDLLDILMLADEQPSAAMAVPQLRQRIECLSSELMKRGLVRGPKRWRRTRKLRRAPRCRRHRRHGPICAGRATIALRRL